jgi:hypothetical protein
VDYLDQRSTEVQQKFNFYLVGLTFGILALSAQTVKFDTPIVARCAELVAWVTLFVSAVTGLYRLELTPQIYGRLGLQERWAELAHQLSLARDRDGTTVIHKTEEHRDYPIDDEIQRAEAEKAKIAAELVPFQRRATIVWQAQRVSFVLGLLLLLFSRGFAPALNIVRDLREPSQLPACQKWF